MSSYLNVLRNIIKRIRNRIEVALHGISIKSKLKLIISTIFDLLPYGKLSRWPLHSILYRIASMLAKNSIVYINGIKYVLTDSGSIETVSPRHENEVYRYLISKMKEGDVFIDVGAHVGKYALQAAKIVGSRGLVIAIEPFPGNYSALLKGISLNNLKNIIALNLAAWNENCKLRLFITEVSSHHSVKNNDLEFIQVEAQTIDSILEKLNVTTCDWIKIDAEGAEYEIIKGLEKCLRNIRPKFIIEVTRHVDDILSFFSNLGYEINIILTLRGKPYYIYCKPPQPRMRDESFGKQLKEFAEY